MGGLMAKLSGSTWVPLGAAIAAVIVVMGAAFKAGGWVKGQEVAIQNNDEAIVETNKMVRLIQKDVTDMKTDITTIKAAVLMRPKSPPETALLVEPLVKPKKN